MAAALTLFGYGYLVNSPPWDFGKLLGVVVFFVVAQAISWIVYDQKPGRARFFSAGHLSSSAERLFRIVRFHTECPLQLHGIPKVPMDQWVGLGYEWVFQLF